MNHARSGDEFVSGIAVEVEMTRGPTHLAREWPEMHATERIHELGPIDVNLDASTLVKFRNFPEDNR